MKPRVLVLDASLTVRMDLAEALAAAGFDAVLSATTEEASVQLASGGFEVAILDAMPDGSGLQLVEHLRARPATEDLPIVLLAEEDVGEAPVDERLGKPYSREALQGRVRELTARRRPSSATPRATLLAVDDSPTFLEWLVESLEADGYTLVKARSGEEALQRLEESPVDVVLLDVQMPGLSGHDTCRRIKSSPKWRSIPVIILTANEDRAAMIEGIDAGADDWVAKSGELDVLRARLSAQLRRRRFEVENARMREELHHTRLAATEARAARRVAEARAELVEEVRHKNAELRRTNEELRELSRRNQMILESAAEGICGLDGEGRITFANAAAAQMLGLSLDALRGRVLHDVVHVGADMQHAAEDCPFLDPVRSGEPRGASDHCFEREDGVRLPIDYVASPMFEGDRPVGVGVLFRDVSERRRLEEQLRHAQKMEVVGRLAGGVAHDFNNLLTAIQGYGSVLAMKLGPDDPRREFADHILASCKRAASLTRQLLAFSRRQVVVPKQVDPNELVSDMCPMLGQLLGEHIDLDVDLEALGDVRVDPGQLEQVVLNLVLNARDAMPAGGRIIVRTRDARVAIGRTGGPAPGDWVVLTVRDEGEGIPDDVRQHLYEPFFTTRASGTGLGLSTVHGIVAQSGGAIEVDSVVGKGTAFHVWLPRLAPVHADEPEAVVAGGETVLVVDDQDAIRDFVCAVLSERGYEVLVAADGREALELVGRGDRIDLLVTDIVMPGMSGQELAAQLRDRLRGVRVLFMSGYTAGVTVPPNLSEGADFLPKPFAADDLIARVRALLDRRRGPVVQRRTSPPP